MLVEVIIAVTLVTVGFVLLGRWSGDLGEVGRVVLSLPIGAAVYLIVALGMVVIVGTLEPGVALGLTALGGLGGLAIGGRRGWSGNAFRWLAVALGATVIIVVAARLLHLTRLTPDSLRYILASNNLVTPDALGAMHPVDLHDRNLAVPSLHALSDLTDRRYLASIGPLFGAAGFGLFVYLTWQATARVERAARVRLIAAATVFLVMSNRLLYDVFYIHTHIYVAVYVLVAMTGIWFTVTRGSPGWAVPAGMSLAVTLLIRPETPLVVALLLVVAASTGAGRATRLWLGLPAVGIVGVWYGMLWSWVPGGDRIAVDAPIFGGIVAVGGAALVLLLGEIPALERTVRRSDLILVGLLGLMLATFVAVAPGIFVDSLEATVSNLVLFQGRWHVTWPVLLALVGVALVFARGPDARLWSVPVVGYLLIWWLLPYLRGNAWRVGTGDSGNRILAHIIFVVVAYVVIAAARIHEANGEPSKSETAA